MDPFENILMVSPWEEKGCEICRNLWETGNRPPELAINYELHSRLHQCASCGTYWEQYERYADVISPDEAQRNYPDYFADISE